MLYIPSPPTPQPTTYREQVIEGKWHDLIGKLDAYRSTLSRQHDLMSVFAEMDDCLNDMAQTEVCGIVLAE